ncbi:M3 family oligoendopeptidase [Lentibacillus salicampi]|uniref:Oligoendopeptidase F n=1 Tax=Lentibacillus salicampi TaxID=175306 RepID=A0A4Y9A8K7_9BACI|nr:M3 family oligoendopeptidase [Lentibacillus salicampi]TFJ91447.1 oligoendopeptidase F [Lentibacillus salicampi]
MEKVLDETWNLDSLYPGGKSSDELNGLIVRLKHDLCVLQDQAAMVDPADIHSLVALFEAVQMFQIESFELDEYMVCLYAVNVDDPGVAHLAEESELIKAGFESLELDIDRIIGQMTDAQWHTLFERDDVKAYQFYLEERKQTIEDKLPVDMEKMISTLSVNGFTGWEDYYEQMMGNLRIPIEQDGETEELSIGQAMSYLFSNDRETRKKTARSIVKVCENQADDFAAVLNRISGFRLDVYRQRGWKLLKEAMKANRIEEETVQTMVSAIKENTGVAQSFYKRKAELMGMEKLSWFDTEMPSFTSENKLLYDEAADIIITQFHNFSKKLGDFAEKAFREGWIEAENRKGKMHGGFCANMPVAKESRIFMTYNGSYQDVVTIAHELGHAYHNHILHDEPAFAQQVSTSVAETASTFAENLVLDAAIDNAETDEEKIGLLEMKITNGLKYQAEVPSLFLFEQKMYEKRKAGPVTADEISKLLGSEMNNLYGDLIDENNPYSWMTVPQLFSTELAFYNVPYTIGYLFSNGIYALAKEQGDAFPEKYDALLRDTGRMTVEELARHHLGKDIKVRAFWETSLQPVIHAVNEYLDLTKQFV